MKYPLVTLVCAALALTGCDPEITLPKAEIDRGGVTFNFKKLGDRRFEKGVDSLNLLTDWQEPFTSVKREWARPLLTLPEGSAGRYRISFRYKMKHSKLPSAGSGGIVMVYRQRWSDKQLKEGKKGVPQQTVGHLVYISLVNAASEWNLATADFDFDLQHAGAYLRVVLDGEGEIQMKDVEIRRLAPSFESEVTITAEPSASLDGSFAVSEGQCGIVTCLWSKRDKDKWYNAGKIEVKTSVTGDFEILESPKRCGTPWKEENNYWNTLGTVVRAKGKPGSEGTLCFEVVYEGKRISNVETVRLFTVPVIHATVPARYTAGFIRGGTYLALREPVARQSYMENCIDWGVRWVVTQKELLADWRKAGISYAVAEVCACNGYGIATDFKTDERPEDERWVSLTSLKLQDFPGNKHEEKSFAKYSCPVSVYEEMPFFKNQIVPYMKKEIEGFDGNWSNWEPYATDGQGCFCTKCAKKFAAHLKVPEEEVLKGWPRCVLRNKNFTGRYADKEPRFRSLEHAKVIKTLDKYITKFTGGEKSVGFLPGIGFDQVTSVWKEYDLAAYYQPHDYMGELKWIAPWGPYTHWKSHTPYVYFKGDVLRSWCAAKDIRETVDREFPASHRPKLQSFPQGAQGDGWITQPEWLEMSMDAFFLNGWESTCVYFFPKGYDARWWRAFANHVNRAAKYERAVWDGVRTDASVVLEPVAEYAHPVSYIGGRFPQFRNVALLQHAAYDFEGRRTVAVLNYWDFGEAFFKLRATGLPSDDYAIVDEKGILWAPSRDKASWSAAELASGIELVVPATRTRVFEIIPTAQIQQFQQSDDQTIFSFLTSSDVKSLYAVRRPELHAAADADAAYERENKCEPKKTVKGEVYK
ncbi:MAG: hypothetical protein WC340_07175 [Kiritimatiellia bacterium]